MQILKYMGRGHLKKTFEANFNQGEMDGLVVPLICVVAFSDFEDLY